MAPSKPYYHVTHDYRPETSISSKVEICIPKGQSPPERIAMPFVPSLKDLSEGDNDKLLSFIQSLCQHKQVMADLNNASLNQDIADLDDASHTYSDDGDKGNVTFLSIIRKWLCCVCLRRMTSKAYVMC
ncbi:hypothetical protein VC83_07575 [Pseudogymnoascus destructans]|uniref:Uncharacterized protein n=1 Tax=Pseudogymnoascus destructans TaxID=655981 RepID=A0A177A069_9PEZI|nr:uncharacterized protein VC83_07575 [Pseudogymnoascus destructans]OAF55538.1 hypothetical protein VC83_07575 [Pseudogymnoascus destructans]